MPENKQNKHEVSAEHQPFANEATRRLLAVWFAKNDSIKPVFSDEEGGGYGLTNKLDDDGKRILRLPPNITASQLKDIVGQIDSDMFKGEEGSDAGVKSLEQFGRTLASLGKFAASHTNDMFFVSGKDREAAKKVILSLYNFGQALVSDDKTTPQPIETFAEIPTNKPITEADKASIENLLTKFYSRHPQPVKPEAASQKQRILTAIKHMGFIARHAKEEKQPRVQPTHDEIMEFITHHGRPETKPQETKPRRNNIAKFIDRFEQQITATQNRPAQELDTAALRRGMEYLKREMKARWDDAERSIYDKLDIPKLKEELRQLRESDADETEISQTELDIIEKIQYEVGQVERQEDTDNPTEMIANQELNCVGASLLAGSLLSELGIDYRVIDMIEHSALATITTDGKLYWRDMLFPDKNIEITDDMIKGNMTVADIIKSPDKIFTVHPDFSHAQGGEYERAKDFDADLLPPTIGQESQMFNNLGDALRAEHDYPAAIAAYRKDLEINPNDTCAWNNLGIALKNQPNPDYPAAIAAFQRALEINPNDTYAWNNLGNALKNQPNPDYLAAIAAYLRALGINPDYDDA